MIHLETNYCKTIIIYNYIYYFDLLILYLLYIFFSLTIFYIMKLFSLSIYIKFYLLKACLIHCPKWYGNSRYRNRVFSNIFYLSFGLLKNQRLNRPSSRFSQLIHFIINQFHFQAFLYIGEWDSSKKYWTVSGVKYLSIMLQANPITVKQ